MSPTRAPSVHCLECGVSFDRTASLDAYLAPDGIKRYLCIECGRYSAVIERERPTRSDQRQRRIVLTEQADGWYVEIEDFGISCHKETHTAAMAALATVIDIHENTAGHEQ